MTGVYSSSASEKNTKKEKNNILVVILVVLGMSAVGQMVGKSMAKSYVEDSKSDGIVLDNTKDTEKTEIPSIKEIDPKPEVQPTEESTSETEANPEYTKIFSDRFIVQMPPMFMTKGSASFAKVTEEGMVESIQVGYSDDVITDMVETIYIDVSTMSDSDKEAMDATLSGKYAGFESQAFLTISTNMGTNYYSFSCKMTKLDVKENLTAAIDAGLINANSADSTGAIDFLSMSATESALLSGGYVKK